MSNKQKILKSEDIYKQCGKYYKRPTNTSRKNILEDESFQIPLPIDYIPRVPFHLDSTFIPLALEELSKPNSLEENHCQELVSRLTTMNLSVPTSIIFSNLEPSIEHTSLMRTPRKPKHKVIEACSPTKMSRSPKPLRHVQSPDCYIAVKPGMIWYESYISIEPIPEGMKVDRDVERVKCEFEHIISNIYLTKVPPRKKNDDLNVCTCMPPNQALSILSKPNAIPIEYTRDDLESFSRTACGDRCINRLCYCECDPMTCPCGASCTNQMFRKKEYQKLILFYAPKKGWGLKAASLIPKGTFIIEYVGEVISQKESELRIQRRQGQLHMYYMSLGPDQLIDATVKGNASRFINHSCDPNCETQKWTTGSVTCIGIFAARDIQKGEELTFDYQFERIGNTSTPCFCGSPKCRHMLDKSKEVANTNNLPLSTRLTRNRLYQCDCTLDPIDQRVMPTTLVPFACKNLTKTLTSYITSFDLDSLPSSHLISVVSPCMSCPTDPSHFFQPHLIEWEGDEEDHMIDAPIPAYYRFSSRGRKRAHNTSLLLNRNISDGLKRFCWMYDKKRALRLGLVDTAFKKDISESVYSAIAM